MSNKQYYQSKRYRGRNVRFTPAELWEQAVYYFEYTEKHPLKAIEIIKDANLQTKKIKIPKKRVLTLKGFCLFAGFCTDYITDLKKGQKKKLKRLQEEGSHQVDINECEDYLDTIQRIKDIIYVDKFEGATAGLYNASIIARDLGLTEKTKVEAEIDDKQTFVIKLGDQEFEI